MTYTAEPALSSFQKLRLPLGKVANTAAPSRPRMALRPSRPRRGPPGLIDSIVDSRLSGTQPRGRDIQTRVASDHPSTAAPSGRRACAPAAQPYPSRPITHMLTLQPPPQDARP